MRIILSVLFGLMTLATAAVATKVNAAPEPRAALVVGNSNYQVGGTLRNAGNDARDVAKRLQALGFDVKLVLDARQREMNRALVDFGEMVKPGGVALFYYAGHGIQWRGQNFLIPIDAEMRREQAVRSEAVNVDQVLDQMAHARVGLVLLDACRNNPFERAFRSGAGAGLAQIDAPKGILISYATAPGRVADDGDGRNSPYTEALLKALEQPDRRVEDIFKDVRRFVANTTADRQLPWESSSLTGDFYFRPPAVAAAAPPPAQPVYPQTPWPPAAWPPAATSAELQVELAFWDAIKNSTQASDYEVYLQQYPDGRFSPLARARLAGLTRSAAAAHTPTPPPQPAIAPQRDPVPPAAAPASNRPTELLASLAIAEPDVGRAATPGVLKNRTIALSGKTIELPLGDWVLVAQQDGSVDAIADSLRQTLQVPWPEPIATIGGVAVAVGASGVDALLSTSSTRSRPPLLKSWEVQPCRVDDALSHDDFSSSYAMPECHYVRRIGRAQLAGDVRFAPALAWAAQHRVGVPETFYEIRYARYANDGFIDATMLIAAPRLNSDDGAIAWGSQFSSAMRPLGRSGSAHAALPTIQ